MKSSKYIYKYALIMTLILILLTGCMVKYNYIGLIQVTETQPVAEAVIEKKSVETGSLTISNAKLLPSGNYLTEPVLINHKAVVLKDTAPDAATVVRLNVKGYSTKEASTQFTYKNIEVGLIDCQSSEYKAIFSGSMTNYSVYSSIDSTYAYLLYFPQDTFTDNSTINYEDMYTKMHLLKINVNDATVEDIQLFGIPAEAIYPVSTDTIITTMDFHKPEEVEKYLNTTISEDSTYIRLDAYAKFSLDTISKTFSTLDYSIFFDDEIQKGQTYTSSPIVCNDKIIFKTIAYNEDNSKAVGVKVMDTSLKEIFSYNFAKITNIDAKDKLGINIGTNEGYIYCNVWQKLKSSEEYTENYYALDTNNNFTLLEPDIDAKNSYTADCMRTDAVLPFAFSQKSYSDGSNGLAQKIIAKNSCTGELYEILLNIEGYNGRFDDGEIKISNDFLGDYIIKGINFDDSTNTYYYIPADEMKQAIYKVVAPAGETTETAK